MAQKLSRATAVALAAACLLAWPMCTLAADPVPFVDGSWTMVFIPDTQKYASSSSPAVAGIFTQITSWMVAQKDARNVRFVMGGGDITDYNTVAEWQRVKASVSVLDGQLPYALATGNHDYGTAADPDGTNDGEELWQKLVRKHGNFEMTLNGHVLNDGLGYLASTADDGNTVHQMLYNAQLEPNGGNGWLRLLEFLPDGETIQVKTYSPYLDQWRTGPADEFALRVSLVPEPATLALDGLALVRRKR